MFDKNHNLFWFFFYLKFYSKTNNIKETHMNHGSTCHSNVSCLLCLVKNKLSPRQELKEPSGVAENVPEGGTLAPPPALILPLWELVSERRTRLRLSARSSLCADSTQRPALCRVLCVSVGGSEGAITETQWEPADASPSRSLSLRLPFTGCSVCGWSL